ncbi:MAG: hypothetical protein AB7P04_15885, partial [Bacteriovoracia bacterium]
MTKFLRVLVVLFAMGAAISVSAAEKKAKSSRITKPTTTEAPATPSAPEAPVVATPASVPPVEIPAESLGGSARNSKRFGIYASLLGEPFPALYGFNLGYNVIDVFRFHAGYGMASTTSGNASISLKTIGFGVKAMVPGWNFTPVVGFGYSIATLTLTGNTSGLDIGGFSASGNTMSVSFGIDWQTEYGLNFGLGYIKGLQ